MTRLLPVLFCCLIGISLSVLHFNKKEAEKESEENSEASPVTDLTINSALTKNLFQENKSTSGQKILCQDFI
jgi:hypothetical protein